MKIIGLTGGIGSGKSTVSDYLISKGFYVLDADRIAREIVLPGSEMLIELKAIFGAEIILEDGSLNRKKLGEIIFSDAEKKKVLDKLMHTRVLEMIHERILEYHEGKIIFIDAPLLFETGLDRSVSEVWVIDVEDEIRIRRIMERDGLEREDILKRIRSQMGRKEKNRRADAVLDNSGDVKALYQQIEKLLENI